MITKCSADTALRNINDLVEKGMLEKPDASGRSTSYEVML
ncbi:cell filamentation protein Fic [Psychrobacter sp. W2-37-MNA-CIBAN-0211]